MLVDVKVPSVGESVQEGMIESWKKKNGDDVARDDVLFLLETDKATVEIMSEASGKIQILTEAGKVVKIGDVVAKIDTQAAASKTQAVEKPAPIQAAQPEAQPDPGPAVRKILAENPNTDTQNIKPTGRGGRLTKEDLIVASSSDKKPAEKTPTLIAAVPQPQQPSNSERESTRKPMSMIRRRIAERLLNAQESAAILTTFNEVDMSQLMDLRKKYKDRFEEKYKLKLGFMGFFVKASVEALKAFPLVNAYIEEQDIVYHNYCDVGVAVSTEKGLMVPVIRNAHNMQIWEVEQAISEFAKKARDNKIALEDLEGGTFTVSNGGVFGSLLSTPILNPPQSAILGMHKTQMRPVVLESGEIVARPMMYLALSYDHRIIDGKEAVGFLVKVKECLEDPARMILGV